MQYGLQCIARCFTFTSSLLLSSAPCAMCIMAFLHFERCDPALLQYEIYYNLKNCVGLLWIVSAAAFSTFWDSLHYIILHYHPQCIMPLHCIEHCALHSVGLCDPSPDAASKYRRTTFSDSFECIMGCIVQCWPLWPSSLACVLHSKMHNGHRSSQCIMGCIAQCDLCALYSVTCIAQCWPALQSVTCIA